MTLVFTGQIIPQFIIFVNYRYIAITQVIQTQCSTHDQSIVAVIEPTEPNNQQ